MRTIAALIIGLVAIATPALAEGPARSRASQTVLFDGAHRPTDDELREILFGDRNGPPLRTRGIVFQSDNGGGAPAPAPAPVEPAAAPAYEPAYEPAAPAAPVYQPAYEAPRPVVYEPQAEWRPIATPEPEAEAPRSVAFNIEFGFNSADMPARYLGHLEELAQALASPEAAGRKVLIVGHTDMLGSDAYNETLSWRRALATRQVLIERFNVPADRLVPMGKGKSEPLPGLRGDAAQHRRVEFVVAS